MGVGEIKIIVMKPSRERCEEPRVWWDSNSRLWRWARSFYRSDEDQGLAGVGHGSERHKEDAIRACYRSEFSQRMIRNESRG